MKVRQLPFHVRLTLGIMYLVALGLILTSVGISILRGFTIGYIIGLILETFLLYLPRKE